MAPAKPFLARLGHECGRDEQERKWREERSIMPTETIIHAGTLRPEQEKGYVHLPFDVPAGAVEIRVEYSYSNRIGSSPYLSGGNTIDLGVFDANALGPSRRARGVDHVGEIVRRRAYVRRVGAFAFDDRASLVDQNARHGQR